MTRTKARKTRISLSVYSSSRTWKLPLLLSCSSILNALPIALQSLFPRHPCAVAASSAFPFPAAARKESWLRRATSPKASLLLPQRLRRLDTERAPSRDDAGEEAHAEHQ